MKRLLVTSTLVAAVVTACATPEADQPDRSRPPADGANTVELRNIQFTPATLTVEAGSQVTWVWNDGSVAHNVVGGDFSSDIETDSIFTHRFAQAGTYDYVCTLHPGMEGTIIVEEAS